MCLHVIFPFHFHVVQEVSPKMVQKTMNLHVLFNLTSTTTMFASFGLQMSRGDVDTFILVINLSDSWIFMHATIGLFEVHDITKVSMARQLESLFRKYDLTHRMNRLCDR